MTHTKDEGNSINRSVRIWPVGSNWYLAFYHTNLSKDGASHGPYGNNVDACRDALRLGGRLGYELTSMSITEQ